MATLTKKLFQKGRYKNPSERKVSLKGFLYPKQQTRIHKSCLLFKNGINIEVCSSTFRIILVVSMKICMFQIG